MRSSLRLLTSMMAVLIMASGAWAQDQKAAADDAKKVEKAKAEEAEGIDWLTYEEGMAKAKEHDKPILIDFTASWCGWCKRMDRETFSNAEVVDYMNDNLVPVKVWGDSDKKTSHNGEIMSEKALTRLYGVRGFPTFWFLNSQGEKIGPSPGYKQKDQFLPLIQYVAGDHYKSMSYESFLKQGNGEG